jgi:hypothetical protein
MIPDFENVKLHREDKKKSIMYTWKGGGKIQKYKINGELVEEIAVKETKEHPSFSEVKRQMRELIDTPVVKKSNK